MISFNKINSLGRLGNQLFQYAFVRTSAQRLGVKFYCPPWIGDQVFALKDKAQRSTKPLNKPRIYRQPNKEVCYSQNALQVENNTDIEGYFQTDRYYSDKQEVKKWFAFKKQSIARVEKKYQDINFEKSVGLHLRLGDWIPPYGKIFHRYIPRKSYYKKALAELGKNKKILVFSDNIIGAKIYFEGIKGNIKFMDSNQPYEDLYLMSQCKYFISSPSTLSWWAAWLNKYPDKKVIVPKEGALRSSKRHLKEGLKDYWPLEYNKIRSQLPILDNYTVANYMVRIREKISIWNHRINVALAQTIVKRHRKKTNKDVTGSSSILDRIGEYLHLCHLAAHHKDVLAVFRRLPVYQKSVESVSARQGGKFAGYIMASSIDISDYIEECRMSDSIGNPRKFTYPILGRFAPATLRYIKIQQDLISLFGDMNKMNIIEIGAGYGGQCRIAYCISEPKGYTVVDLPMVLELIQKYLAKSKVRGVKYISAHKLDLLKKYDVVISNYAFSECIRSVQDEYIDKVLAHTKRGYLICNYSGKRGTNLKDRYTTDQIIKKLSKYHKLNVQQEEPRTSKDNMLITWDDTK